MNFYLRVLKFLVPRDYILVPKKPTDAHIVSMAIRHDHAFGMQSPWSDEYIEEQRKKGFWESLVAKRILTTKERGDRLTTMRQLYEEATGQGFYQHKL